jgi:hypothetical protein
VATLDDVRRIALALPETTVDESGSVFSVDGKAFAHPWLERLDPKKARVPNLDVLVVRIASEADKEVLIQMDPRVFFTEPHFDGWPSIHVRLAEADEALLGRLLADAWRTRAPKRLHDRT